MAMLWKSKLDSLLDNLGVVRNGGSLEFFASGTSTHLDTYSDNALTTPNANPLTLAAGRPPQNIFLKNADYKVVVTDAAGTDSVTVDPVHGLALTGVSQGYALARICPAGTVAPLPACTYNNGAAGVGATLTGNANGALPIDGYVLSAGDIGQPFMINNQANAVQNGIFLCTQPGSGGTPFVLTRAPWFNSTASAITGIYGVAEESQTIPNTRWLFTNPGTIVFGTTPITFTRLTTANPLYIGADGNLALVGLDWAANSAPRFTGHWEFQSPTNDRAIVVEAKTTYGSLQYGLQVDYGNGGTAASDLLSAFNHDVGGGSGYQFQCSGDDVVRVGKFCVFGTGFAAGAAVPAGTTYAVVGADTFAKMQLTSSNLALSVGSSGGIFAINDYNNANTLWQISNAGGIQVGVPTGGDKGAHTINSQGDIYKQGTAYTNPDYVLEYWATGKIQKYADKEGAKDYRPKTLAQFRAYAKRYHHLPGLGQHSGKGIFDGGDAVLANLESACIYIFELEERLTALEARLKKAGL